MTFRRQTPIIVGVGDVVNRSTKVEDAREPAQLMLEAIQLALHDTGLSLDAIAELESSIDSLDVVRTWTWPYPDLPGLLAQRLRIQPRHKHYSEHGGNQPGKLFDLAARRISVGETKVAIVTGGEALASLTACANANKMPPPGWTTLDKSVESVFSPTTRDLGENLGAIHSIGAPIHLYPLFENGFRAHRNQSIQQNNDESAKLYADFAKVSERNPYAWSFGKTAETAESIKTVTKRNRMICFPYPLLMNAFNVVNLAGAVLLTSVEYAEELGIPQSKWIYTLGAAGTEDSHDFWDRPNFHSSPSISRSIDAGLQTAGLTKETIDLYDFYSCFPIVPKIACHHLDIDVTQPSKPLTLLGGLTSFGGAGNNYSMHAITEMTRQLRQGNGINGLVLANGGFMTYQHVVILSSQPRKDGGVYPNKSPLPDVLNAENVPIVDKIVEGEAVVETYTVEFNRDGTPLRGHVVGRRTSNGHRFIANHADMATLQQLCSQTEEPIGRSGYVRPAAEKKGRNLFAFRKQARL